MKKIVFVTIGEAPRLDIADSFATFFQKSANVKQDGLLNGLTMTRAEKLLSSQGNEEVVVSTFCNGQSIRMSKEKVQTRMQQKIDDLEAQGVDVIVVLCTAEFEKLTTKKAILVEPERILLPYIQQKFGKQQLGVMLPLTLQIEAAEKKWHTNQLNPIFASASPYDFSEETFAKAGNYLQKAGAEAIILDCMGYSRYMSEFVIQVTGLPVYQSNELLFEYVQHTF